MDLGIFRRRRTRGRRVVEGAEAVDVEERDVVVRVVEAERQLVQKRRRQVVAERRVVEQQRRRVAAPGLREVQGRVEGRADPGPKHGHGERAQVARLQRRLRRVEVPPLEAIRPARLPWRRTRCARQRLVEEALVLRLRHRGSRSRARRTQEVDTVRLKVVHSAGGRRSLLVRDCRAEQPLQRHAVAVRQPRVRDAREPLAIEVLQSRG